MKVGQPRSNRISQIFHIDHLTEEEKKNQTVTKDQTKKWVFLLWGWYGQRGFLGWDQWERKPVRSLSKIEAEGGQRKTKKLLWCRNICSRSHQKRYPWINTKKIIIIINYSLKKWPIQERKKRKWKKVDNY